MSAARLGLAWRFVALGGLVGGLALSPLRGLPDPLPLEPLAVAALALVLRRPRAGAPWLVAVALVAATTGLSLGAERIAAIDAGAFHGRAGAVVEVRGFADSLPRPSAGGFRLELSTPQGRLAVASPDAPDELSVGDAVIARGALTEPSPWEAAGLRRKGIALVLRADSLEPAPGRRGGIAGVLDTVRRRSQDALASGTDPLAAALLRGFVLGQDEQIPPGVRDEFRRSGLAHILAVSGQNVMLLVLLATPLLALAGVPLRARLLVLVAIVAVYVPVAGAGPSIQRAGVMGAAGLVAALADRPRARWYALLLAAAVTLGLEPRASGDVGWQLSFAAVAGILVLAAPLARLLAGAGAPSPARRAFAEGAALTIAATVATAPLVAHHFGTVSLTALPANLLALPAVAPAMWLGMLAGALGQVPSAPVEALTALGGLCSGFIGWVAASLGPPWAELELDGPEPPAVLATYLVLAAATWTAMAAARRRRGLRIASAVGGRDVARRRRIPRIRLAVVAGGLAALAGAALAFGPWSDSGPTEPFDGLRVTMLDVGQGDAILIRPPRGDPLLVDTGPAGSGLTQRLGELGVERLAAVAITHDQADHSGGLPEVLGDVSTGRLLVASGGTPAVCVPGACPRTRELAAGERVRAGGARIDVLWPPPLPERVTLGTAEGAPAPDPNLRSLVLLLSWRDFELLLTGDAEAEAASYEPGPLDALKLAHHGSEDAGLPGFLERSAPRVALVSVGAANPYGHPAEETLATLAEAGVETVRTDLDGEVTIAVGRDGWSVE